jgi:serine/threonine protein kinase
VKLADFGCSKIFAGIKSHFRTVLGTPFWMAPEVIKQTGMFLLAGREVVLLCAHIRDYKLGVRLGGMC